jgi:hypothetical protein
LIEKIEGNNLLLKVIDQRIKKLMPVIKVIKDELKKAFVVLTEGHNEPQTYWDGIKQQIYTLSLSVIILSIIFSIYLFFDVATLLPDYTLIIGFVFSYIFLGAYLRYPNEKLKINKYLPKKQWIYCLGSGIISVLITYSLL